MQHLKAHGLQSHSTLNPMQPQRSPAVNIPTELRSQLSPLTGANLWGDRN
jgi:hypothetical protein